ncbi:MAG: monovalent cation/H+ antiporter complex subunit F [Trueperaceae bacterium]|nr:monovalent cation/H+ antiporter complex subunit F [Trueperaceae bacterium]
MIFFAPDISPILRIASIISFVMVTAALLLTVVRLILGPSLPDRVVALDLLSVLAISFIAIYSMSTSRSVFLDAALALALVSFLGTVAFARYIEWWSDKMKDLAASSSEEPQHD